MGVAEEEYAQLTISPEQLKEDRSYGKMQLKCGLKKLKERGQVRAQQQRVVTLEHYGSMVAPQLAER